MRNAEQQRPTIAENFSVTEQNPASAELLQQFRHGDSSAAATLHDRYVARLVSLARSRLRGPLAARVDAEDVVQSAYRSFFLRARAGEFELQHSGDLWRLLARITLRKLYRQAERHTAARRSIAREQDTNDDHGAIAVSREPTPDEAAALADELASVMQRLSKLERAVLELRLQDHTIDEIAAQLGRSERTIRRTLAAIRSTLAGD
jgi:RNA polymerase sigma factor (sigma-70 family)